MRVRKNNRNWLRVVVLSAVLTPTTITLAQQPSPLERAGRICGVCWGDGYHACSDSKLRLGADLPPRSFSASRHARTQSAPHGVVHRLGATFYDRFDAASGRPCDGPTGCDVHADCDGLPITIDGSQVILGRQPWSTQPVIADPKPGPVSPKPAASIKAAVDPMTATNGATPISTPLAKPSEQAPTAKKYPIRPKPPVNATRRSIELPVTSTRPSLGSDSTAAASRDPFSTQTPGMIEPDPGQVGAITRPDRLLNREPQRTSTPAMVMPTIDIPAKPSLGPETRIVPTQLPAAIPSYATEPPVTPAAVEPPIARPQRLGTQSAPTPAPNRLEQSTSSVIRPTRLGGTGSVQINPYHLNKPAIELARRSSSSNDNVIYQPTAGSLK